MEVATTDTEVLEPQDCDRNHRSRFDSCSPLFGENVGENVGENERVETMKIEGVPEGWELVRIGQPLGGELYLGHNGAIVISTGSSFDKNCPILRKTEKPKQYRPFANAEEFKPHRDRWCKISDCWSRVQNVAENRVYFRAVNFTWEQAYIEITFDDNTPFGVEVGE